MQKKQDHSKQPQQTKPAHQGAPKGDQKKDMGSCSTGDKGKKGGSCG